jgi:hypothetical protein
MEEEEEEVPSRYPDMIIHADGAESDNINNDGSTGHGVLGRARGRGVFGEEP